MIHDCWNLIGVRGDGSCPELVKYAHCHNCPVHAAAASELLGQLSTDDTIVERTRHIAQPRQVEERDSHSAIVFRVGGEWLALATSVMLEVTSARPVHSLPHRQNRVVQGVINVNGELLVSVSLAAVLGIESPAAPEDHAGRVSTPRLLIIRHDGCTRAACPIDEVHGVMRFHPRVLRDVPATLARASVSFAKKLLPWEHRSVGLLDERQLFETLKRSFA